MSELPEVQASSIVTAPASSKPSFTQASHDTSAETFDPQDCSTKFTLFPKLPIELRHKIWGHPVSALPADEFLEVCVGELRRGFRCNKLPPHGCTEKDDGCGPGCSLVKFDSPYYVSKSILYTSSEPREFFLNSLPDSLPSYRPWKELRFHPEKTTVYINNFETLLFDIVEGTYGELAICETHSYKFEKIQRVAIDAECFKRDPDYEEEINSWWFAILFDMFSDLKVIVAVRGGKPWCPSPSREDVERWRKVLAEDEGHSKWRSSFPELQFCEGKLQTFYWNGQIDVRESPDDWEAAWLESNDSI